MSSPNSQPETAAETAAESQKPPIVRLSEHLEEAANLMANLLEGLRRGTLRVRAERDVGVTTSSDYWAVSQAQVIANYLTREVRKWFGLYHPPSLACRGNIDYPPEDLIQPFRASLAEVRDYIGRYRLTLPTSNAFDEVMEALVKIEEMVRSAYHERGAKWEKEHYHTRTLEVSCTDDAPPVLSKHIELSSSINSSIGLLELPLIDKSLGDADSVGKKPDLIMARYLGEARQAKGAPEINLAQFRNNLTMLRREIDAFVSSQRWTVDKVPVASTCDVPSGSSHWNASAEPFDSEARISLLFRLTGPSVSVFIKPAGVKIVSQAEWPLATTIEDPLGLLSLMEGYASHLDWNEGLHGRYLAKMETISRIAGSLLDTLPQQWPAETASRTPSNSATGTSEG
jgi:hypothetical protein